jgi:hypothetical protein
METMRSAAQEALEDIFFGQVVIIWARWFLILAFAMLALWTATTETQLTTTVLAVAALMAINFLLHGRYMMEKPANRWTIAASSLLDLGVVTAIVLFGSGRQGVLSPFFIFYYPVILAFALVFPPRVALTFGGLAVLAYVAACVLGDPLTLGEAANQKQLVARLITLGATAGLGAYYWRLQRAGRRAAVAAPANGPAADAIRGA